MPATHLAVWSSGMIPASGAGGPGFNSRNSPVSAHRHRRCQSNATPKPTPVGFEPTRGDPIGLAGRRLNHSAKVSLTRSAQPHGAHTHTHARTHTHHRTQHGHRRATQRKRKTDQLDQGTNMHTANTHADATHQWALQMASGPVAQWIRHRPTEPGIAGSSPAGVICTTRRPAGVICTTRRLRNRSPQGPTKRHRGDSNPCGQSPMDFESISLTARTQCLVRNTHTDNIRTMQET